MATNIETAELEPATVVNLKLCRQCKGDLHYMGGELRCGECGFPANRETVHEKALRERATAEAKARADLNAVGRALAEYAYAPSEETKEPATETKRRR